MKHYRYIGNDEDFVGQTALGREINGNFHVQVDSLTHYMSHGWYITDRDEWEESPTEISAELLAKLKTLASKAILRDREDCVIYEALGSNVDDCYDRGCDDGEVILAREIVASLS